MRDIRGSDFSGGFVPAIAITVAIAMSLVSLVMLVYFVHHVSSSIQASHIVSTISKEMEALIPKLYPSNVGSSAASDSSLKSARDQECHSIGVEKGGYLETIDVDALLKIATQSNLFLEIVSKPGDRLVQHNPIMKVWSAAPVDDKVETKLLGTILIGTARTPAQDIRYQFQQLTDVVVRALSPGINDPFTAINGIDALASALILPARRPRVPKQRQDKQGTPRLLIAATGIGELLHTTVGHIAVYAAADRFVMTRPRELLNMLEPDLIESSEFVALHTLQNDLSRQRQAQEAQQ